MNHRLFRIKFFQSKFIRFSFTCLIIIFCLAVIFSSVFSFLAFKQEQKINSLIENLTYAEHNMNSELSQLESFITKPFLSKKANAKLYKALAEISYMTGNHSLYNKYMANAFYYAESIHDTESVIYLTNKYIGLLYANGCFEAAEKVLQTLSTNYDISIFSIDIQASYYLSCADVAQMLEKENAELLKKAHDCIVNMNQGSQQKLLQAKLDMLTARNHIQNKNYSLAKGILLNYNESNHFGLEAEQVYVVCDFQIPYYEIMAKILLNDEDITEAYKHIDNYLTACDKYNFRGMKLRMLQYIDEHASKNDIQKYLIIKNQTFSENLNDMTNQYGNFLLSDMNRASNEKEEQAHKRETIIREIIMKCILLYIGFFVYYIILFIIDNLSRDELTNLYNRHKYQSTLQTLARKKIYYNLLVLDIDNFKKINDTFGHETGDYVLRSIGKILLEYENKDISVFRYGGEELCVIFSHLPEYYVREISDDIRMKIYTQISTEQMLVTVSGGIATSYIGEDVFSLADERLYKAKTNGKNKII